MTKSMRRHLTNSYSHRYTGNSRGKEPRIYLMSVAIFVCRRSRLLPFWLTSSRHVAVLVCRRFGVAILACRRFSLSPF